MKSRMQCVPINGPVCMRVLFDIVKRRSFRANVKRRQAVETFCALLMACSTLAFIHRPTLRMIMSVKLDRLAVGSILKQERSF